MRSSKYNDYRVFRIVLFLLLVVLGLFIYIKCIKAPLEHTAPENKWVVEKEATCTADGSRCKICTECGEKFDFETIPATGHKTSYYVDKEPTCTLEGSGCQKCEQCGDKFDFETIPATGHKASSTPVRENDKAPTCTEGGSYDNVTYCKVCDVAVAKETVQVEPNGHTMSPVYVQQNLIPPTHVVHGSYENVYSCSVCRAELSRQPQIIDPVGHDYSWVLVYDANTLEYTMIGTCGCEEDGNLVLLTSDDGLVITRDTNVATCCINRFIGTITFEGKTIVRTIDLPVEEEHKLHKLDIVDDNGEVINTIYIPVTDYALWDDQYGFYYDINTDGIRYYPAEDNKFDENGFAHAVYECVACKDKDCEQCIGGYYWYVVVVYSADHDTRIN